MSTEISSQPKGSITVTLFIGGRDFDPEELTALSGLQPARVWRASGKAKGDPLFSQIAWRYELRRRPHWSVDDAVNEMLDLLNPRREQIIAFLRHHDCNVNLHCRIYGDETVLIYQVEFPTIERMAKFGCSFSFKIDWRAYTRITEAKRDETGTQLDNNI
jgi:hypothetical protein